MTSRSEKRVHAPRGADGNRPVGYDDDSDDDSDDSDDDDDAATSLSCWVCAGAAGGLRKCSVEMDTRESNPTWSDSGSSIDYLGLHTLTGFMFLNL